MARLSAEHSAEAREELTTAMSRAYAASYKAVEAGSFNPRVAHVVKITESDRRHDLTILVPSAALVTMLRAEPQHR